MIIFTYLGKNFTTKISYIPLTTHTLNNTNDQVKTESHKHPQVRPHSYPYPRVYFLTNQSNTCLIY